MITPQYLQRMTRYNRWQNESLYGAADTLSEDARRADRGSFFRSIHETLSHILWADQIWMSRLSDWDAPSVGIAESGRHVEAWDALKTRRTEADATFITWADGLDPSDTDGDLTWFSGAMQRELVRPKAVCMMQVFNHQTHHRGQVHAMLTAAGAKPEDTDIPFMPDAYL
ncbi:MAG: DinB family protein [Hyphomonadaceae bacterium]|nr:DinB family protein [Hyphomonadaceae bacterium]